MCATCGCMKKSKKKAMPFEKKELKGAKIGAPEKKESKKTEKMEYMKRGKK